MLDDTAAGQAAKEGEAFAEEGIEQILSGRTEKRQIGGRAGNSFSVATFAAPEVRRSAARLSAQLLNLLIGWHLMHNLCRDTLCSCTDSGSACVPRQVQPQNGMSEREYWQNLMPEALEQFDAAVRIQTHHLLCCR